MLRSLQATTTIVNGRRRQFAKKVTLLNDVGLTRRKIILLVLVTLVQNIFDLFKIFNILYQLEFSGVEQKLDNHVEHKILSSL